MRFACSVLLVLGLNALAASDWPQFLGPHRNGSSDEAPGRLLWPAEGPRVVWQMDAGAGWSGPAVAGGRLVLFHRKAGREVVQCLDAATGAPLWTFDYPTEYRDDFGFDDGPRATPTLHEGRVYTYGADGDLHCLDLETGKKLWHADLQAELGAPKGYFGRVCSPLIMDEAVLMNPGGRPGAGIAAFHRETGRLLWKSTEEEASYSSPVAATLQGRRMALFFTASGLVAIDPEAGAVLGRHALSPRIRSSVSAATPLVVGDSVFISASYGAGAALVDWKEGGFHPVWSGDEMLSCHYATAVEEGGFLYGFHGRQEQGCEFRCVEARSGAVRWSEKGLGAGTVLRAGKLLLVLTDRGELLAVTARPERFEAGHRAQVLPFGVRAYPALSRGRLFARSENKLVCLQLWNP